MQTETSTSCASSRRRRLRLVLGALCVLTAFPQSSGATNALEPKQPESKTTKVRITHTHRAVQACQYEPSKPEPHCVAKFAPKDPRTKIQLLPVRPASLEARDDVRKPVDIALGSGGESSQAVADVAKGRWEVAWWPHSGQDRFDAAPPATVEVALETISGACELGTTACKLVRSAVKRRVRIAHE